MEDLPIQLYLQPAFLLFKVIIFIRFPTFFLFSRISFHEWTIPLEKFKSFSKISTPYWAATDYQTRKIVKVQKFPVVYIALDAGMQNKYFIKDYYLVALKHNFLALQLECYNYL